MTVLEGVQTCPPPLPQWGTADANIKPPTPLVGAQGYQRFHLSKPVVGQNTALHAVPAYRASTYLVSAYPAHSTLFSPNFSNPQRWKTYQVVNQNSFLW